VLGWVGVALVALAVLLIALLVVAGTSSGTG
jgi:hypothetical protein